MSTGLIEMRVQAPSTDVNQRASDGTQGQVTQSPATLASDDPDCTEARAYGAAFVKILGRGSRTWEEVEPLIRNGWASRHNEVCDTRYDWRLSWPVVKHGWRGAGGAFDLLSPPRTPEMRTVQ